MGLAEEAPAPTSVRTGVRTPEQAADAALAAQAAGDEAVIDVLGRGPEPDPWLVVDGLLARGSPDVAHAIARAATLDAEAMGAYVEAVRATPVPSVVRQAVERLDALKEEQRTLDALELTETLPLEGTTVPVLEILSRRARLLAIVGRFDEATRVLEDYRERVRTLGWTRGEITGVLSQAAIGLLGPSAREGLAIAESAHERAAAIGATSLQAEALQVVALGCTLAGEPEREVQAQSSLLGLREAMADLAGQCQASLDLADALDKVGKVEEAREHRKHALALAEASQLGPEEVAALVALAEEARRGGRLAEALGHLDRATERGATLRRPAPSLVASIHGARMRLLQSLNRPEEALREARRMADAYREARNPVQQVGALESAVVVAAQAGRRDDVRALAEEIEALLPQAASDRQRTKIRGALGRAQAAAGEHARALETLTQALTDLERGGWDVERAAVLLVLSQVYAEMRRIPDAVQPLLQAIQIYAAKGLHENACQAGMTFVGLSLKVGLWDQALDLLARTETYAREASVPEALREVLELRALAHLGRGDHAASVAAVKEWLRGRDALESGLSPVLRTARAGASPVFIGVGAAVQGNRLGDLLGLLEASRGTAFLDAVGGSGRVERAAIAAGDLRAIREARAGEARALAALRAALRQGELSAIRERRAEWELAREQRTSEERRLATDLRARRPAMAADVDLAPERLQAVLAEDEAYVSFTFVGRQFLRALVVTRGEVRLVAWPAAAGKPEAFSAVERVREADSGPEALATLREGILGPLGLPASVRTLVVSPEGPLAFAPWGALREDLSVACVPSASSLIALRALQGRRGRWVLAIGDPAYDEGEAGGGGRRAGAEGLLPRLPASRAEAEGVGDIAFLGGDANETTVRREVARTDPWRALHFACHGLLQSDHPERSSLAFALDPENDGLWTVEGILGSEVRADLVVLSACETARGKTFGTEAPFSLAYAFLLAGAPRVLCSLWKVDDEATRALMEKFYELWNPRSAGGAPGGEAPRALGAAEALRLAQAHVRSQDRWKEPHYWAAWVLWGGRIDPAANLGSPGGRVPPAPASQPPGARPPGSRMFLAGGDPMPGVVPGKGVG